RVRRDVPVVRDEGAEQPTALGLMVPVEANLLALRVGERFVESLDGGLGRALGRWRGDGPAAKQRGGGDARGSDTDAAEEAAAIDAVAAVGAFTVLRVVHERILAGGTKPQFLQGL